MTKDQILSEIKRTAEANGGKPLGWRRFQTETGIRYADWHGKFWVRWNDAVCEAGYSPNKRTAAKDRRELLERYCDLIRELGRLPVSGDLRLKARSDPGFPSENTRGRFGGKASLIEKARDFCRRQTGITGYEEVVRLCEKYLANQPAVADDGEAAHVDGETGFDYLIKSGRFYKIGRSNAPGRREYELATQLPERAKKIHEIATDDPVGIEAYWHQRFEEKRANGEWFTLTASDIASFRRRKFM